MPSNGRTTGKGLGTCFNRALCSHLSRPNKSYRFQKTMEFSPLRFFLPVKNVNSSLTLNSKIGFVHFSAFCMFLIGEFQGCPFV